MHGFEEFEHQNHDESRKKTWNLELGTLGWV